MYETHVLNISVVWGGERTDLADVQAPLYVVAPATAPSAPANNAALIATRPSKQRQRYQGQTRYVKLQKCNNNLTK